MPWRCLKRRPTGKPNPTWVRKRAPPLSPSRWKTNLYTLRRTATSAMWLIASATSPLAARSPRSPAKKMRGPVLESEATSMSKYYDKLPPSVQRRRVYLLHFYNPTTGESARLAHAAHYCGMSEDVSARLAEHGTPRGAKLTLAARKAGLSWVVAAIFPGGRRLEKKLKARHNSPQLCPICKGEVTLAQVLEAQPPPRPRVVGKRVPMTQR